MTPTLTPTGRTQRAQAVRVYVHKPGRAGCTTISIPAAQHAALLALAAGDRALVALVCREASWKLKPADKTAWSHLVIAAAFRRLKRLQIQAREQAEAAWAREHNARVEAELGE